MADTSLYERRTEQEMRILECLVSSNPAVLEIVEDASEFDTRHVVLKLKSTLGLILTHGDITAIDVHAVILRFPKFFPAVPVEAYLDRPIFHPNVHPYTGFACIWSRHSISHTVVEAVGQLQRVITWTSVNQDLEHVMQPNALEWLQRPNRAMKLPLACQLVIEPIELKMERSYFATPPSPFRRRLQ
jgi:hypothetical protein